MSPAAIELILGILLRCTDAGLALERDSRGADPRLSCVTRACPVRDAQRNRDLRVAIELFLARIEYAGRRFDKVVRAAVLVQDLQLDIFQVEHRALVRLPQGPGGNLDRPLAAR